MSKFYMHYKNKPYKYLGVVRHSETLEEMVLYETRYPNDLGSLWVRPKSMFHEEIEINGARRARFLQVPVEYKPHTALDNILLENILELSVKIFGKMDAHKMSERLSQFQGHMILSAWIDEKLIGFKWGYALNEQIFYSWMGGISPGFRGLGIGHELLKRQHQWCREQGYEKIETKTMNCWKDMLMMNLENGYDICGTEKENPDELKIKMEKFL